MAPVQSSSMNEPQQQEKALDSLRDWNKWLIGLNFFTGTGCVIMLQQGVSPLLMPFLVGAILLFALSTIVTALVSGIRPTLVQALPLRDEFGALQSIYDYAVWQEVPLRRFVWLQFLLFVFGIICLLGWVMLKPATS
jgi:hypothetical protein